MGTQWANLSYTRTLQFIPQNDGSIQVVRSYNGTFDDRRGRPDAQSASCPGTLQTGGVTGTFTGYDVVVVTGGVFHPEATCPDPCITSVMVATFFPAEGGPAAASTINNGWEYQYRTAANGTWINRSPGARAGTRRGHRQHQRLRWTEGAGLTRPLCPGRDDLTSMVGSPGSSPVAPVIPS